MKKATKIIESLKAELAAAMVTKEAACDANDSDRFYEACDRIRDLEMEIDLASRPKSKGCKIRAELVSMNVD